MRRRMVAGAMGVTAGVVFMAAPAFAHECTNASRNANNPAAGAQLVFGSDDEVLFITDGLLRPVEQGVVDFETGEGFHGLIAFDVDGDGVADAGTWIDVGPDGEIPLQAQFRGPACRGLTNIGIYFEQCADL